MARPDSRELGHQANVDLLVESSSQDINLIDERLPDLVDLRVEPKRCLEPFDGFGESCVTLGDERLGAVSVSLEIAISGERVLQFSTDERGFGARGVED